jgi:hypothetical protein
MKLTSVLAAALFAASTTVAMASENSYGDSVDFTLPENAILLSQPRQPCRYPSNLYRAGDHCFETTQPVALEKPKKVEPVPEAPKADPEPVAPANPENG